MKRFKLRIGIALLAAAFGAAVQAQFIPGSLAILRLGDGTETLINTGNTLFIDQYTTNGSLVNTVTLPDSGPSSLILSGVATSEGGMTRSLDRATLVLAGYNTNRASVTTSLSSTAAAAVPRGIAAIDANGKYSLLQTTTNFFNGNNPRCVVADGANNFWVSGGNSGTVYFSPPAPPVAVQTGVANTRCLRIAGGNIYFSTQSGTVGIYVLAGLPTSPVSTNLLFATGSSSQPSAFDLSPSLSVAYVADQRASNAGGIQKWTNNGTAWVLAYTFGVGTPAPGAFGVTVDFSGPAPIIYATTGEGSANRLIRIVDTDATAAFTLLATAGAGQFFRAVDFAPDLRPLIVTQPQSQTVANGANVTFSVIGASAFPAGFQWQKNGARINGATAATLTLLNVTAADQASYNVLMTNQYGVAISAAATLTVNLVTLAPTITAQPQNQTNFAGAGATFSVSATGTGPLKYQWQFNGADLNGQTNATLTFAQLTLANQGNYSVRVSNSAGSANSQTAFLAVLALPPTITTQPASVSVVAGATVTFQVMAGGTPPFSYQWTVGGKKLVEGGRISGSATNALTISQTQPSDAGNYAVIIDGLGGEITSANAVLTVVAGSPPSFVNYASAGSVYAQNFDSLPDPGAATVNTGNPVTINNVTYSLANPFDFAFPVTASGGLGGLGLSNSMAGWYGQSAVASKLGASAGDQSTGGVISFGPTNNAAANRALGLLATSTTGSTAFGVKFINGSTNAFTQINVQFTGELWRQQPGAKTLAFGYWIDPAAGAFSTNLTARLTNLDVNFPTGVFTAVDGTLPANQISLGVTNLAIQNWPPGAALWLTWQMTDPAGTSQGLAIDDLSFSASTAQTVAPASLKIQWAAGNALLSWPVAASGYQLQANSALGPTGGWTTLALPVAVTNGLNTVALPAPSGNQFFRLVR